MQENGYEVHGTVTYHRPGTIGELEQVNGEYRHYLDLSDQIDIFRLFDTIRPDEIYNLAAQSHVGVSFEHPTRTLDVTGMGVTRLLEALKLYQKSQKYAIKFYQASSSEMFGNPAVKLQNEHTPFAPRSPYACAKVMAHNMCQVYRESYGLFICCGILFNHESEKRGEGFVTQKIAKAAARIKAGWQEKLTLGNLESKRDWGHAEDYVRAMWLMMQHEGPDDYVVGTGVCHSVLDFANRAFSYLDLNYQDYVKFDSKHVRPNDVIYLCADATKARTVLKWKASISFDALVERMTAYQFSEVSSK